MEPSPDRKHVWVGSLLGLNSLDKDLTAHTVLDQDLHPRSVSEIVHLDDGSSLLGGPGIVRQIRGYKVERVYDLGLEDTFSVHRIVVLEEEAWIAAEGFGLISLNLRTGEVTNRKVQLGIESEMIHHIFLDRDRNIWIGTRANGIYCLQPSLIHKYDTEDILCSRNITSLSTLYNGKLAIQTSGGLTLRHQNGAFESIFCNNNSNSFGILTKNKRPIILSTLLTFVPNNYQIIKSSAAYELGAKELIYQLSQGGRPDRKHRLIRAEFDGKSWQDRSVIILDIPFQGAQIRHMFLDSTGYFWIGDHQDSLWMITTPHQELTKQDISADTKGYQLPQLQRILLDPEGTIWACGRRSIWNKEINDTTFSKYLEGSIYYDMDIQENGTIWIAAEKGLITIDRDSVQIFGLNGYQKLGEIKAMHIPQSSDTLWLASREGLYSVSLGSLKKRVLSGIRPFISGIKINQFDLNSKDSIRLSLGEGLQIKVQAAVFLFGLPPRFRYRIKKEPWVETESGVINFPTSQTGQITGEIQAALVGGSWGQPLRITYEVRPGFWLHPLTWICLAILIGLAAFAIARFQISKIKKRDAKEREIQQEFHRLEQQAFSAMLNPHFIFNTINSIQQELLEEDPMLAHRHLSKFAKLIRKNMDLSTRSTISLKEELERLSLYLEMEKIRLGDKIETVIQTDPQIATEKIEIPSMILQPYVENAIWHGILLSGKRGTVTVKSNLTTNNQLQIEIVDDGVGIDVAKSKTRSDDHISLGMAITQSRIASFHDETSVMVNQINDETGISKGTLVKITIPLKIQLGRDS